MAEALSKSAKKRAAKQARDAVHAAEEAAAAPAPAPKAEAKAKAAAPAAKAAAAPKAEAKAAAQPKAEAKGKAKKTKPVEDAAPPPKPRSDMDPKYAIEVDDGTGGDWETTSGASKKVDKRQKKKEEEERLKKEQEIAEAKAAKAAAKAGISVAAAPVKVDTSKMTATQAVIAKARELASAPVSVQQRTETADADAPAEEKKVLATAVITVPEEKIGRVIGPKGSNLKLIQEKTGITRIDTDSGQFTVSGEDPEGVAKAKRAILEMVEKGYMSLAYDDFTHVEVMAHPSSFPDLIGKGGEIIRKLKEKLDVEVSIPAVPKGTSGSKKYPVGVAGAKANVEKAQECLESIINYYHHEITHEGKDHVEMEIPGWAYSFVIGKQGSELKHIQNNWDVKVYIPRDNSANSNVVVVGNKEDVDKSKQYIEKLVSGAESRGADKRQDKADDHWGNEEPEEAWMKPYMAPKKK